MKSKLQQSIYETDNTSSTQSLMLEYENYIKQRASITNQKISISYNNYNLSLTPKQIQILELIAKGYSNGKIAKKISIKESAVKLSTYRLMKYLEDLVHKNIDRFYLIIIAQEIILEYKNQAFNQELSQD